MPKVSILKPTDQPTGKNRLLDELKVQLSNPDLNDFRFIVAYAKLGPLLRLDHHLKTWKGDGKNIRAVFGIDQQGTSKEALEYAFENFDDKLMI